MIGNAVAGDAVETCRSLLGVEMGGCMKTCHGLHVKTGRAYLSQKGAVTAPSLSFPQSAPAKSRNENHPEDCGLQDLVVSYLFHL